MQDAERRVGETQEALGEERSRREHVEREKAEWERRGREVETLLKSVKEEVIKGEVEREETLARASQAEQRADAADARAERAEHRLDDALAHAGNPDDGDDATATESRVQRLVDAQMDAKIDAVSRELHAVYKEKHERKVATLKKSYDARAERRAADLQARVRDLELQLAARDATFTGPVLAGDADADAAADDSSPAAATAQLQAELQEQRAALARVQHELDAERAQHAQLALELQRERIEKGELVGAVDEMLALQAAAHVPATPALSRVEDFRRSISRGAGGAAAPAARGTGTRIGKAGSGSGSGIVAPGGGRSLSGGGAGKSRMLANIERMGRTTGGA